MSTWAASAGLAARLAMAAVRMPHTLYARERRLKRNFFIGFHLPW